MRAIETVYKGYRFRSRLEARWAVFFDALELRWEYEPEGFELGDGLRYLPDFKVRYPGRNHSEIHHEWFEVKGDLRQVSDRDWEKMLRFSQARGLTVLDGPPAARMYCTPGGCLSGDLADTEHCPPLSRPYKVHPSTLEFARCGLALWCPKGRMWWDAHENYFAPTSYNGCGDMVLERACEKARAARFEFGEAGV